MTNYELVTSENPNGSFSEMIKRINEDGSISWIPLDPANSDYQAYLKEMNK